MELRYPVRLESFRIRQGSGGAGKRRGGDGIIREILFLEDVSLSVLTQHRTTRPYGLQGGRPGRSGKQYVVTADGERIDLGSIDGRLLSKGDRLVIQTPGGGGFGTPAGKSRKTKK